MCVEFWWSTSNTFQTTTQKIIDGLQEREDVGRQLPAGLLAHVHKVRSVVPATPALGHMQEIHAAY
jgi:hypothetical protein